jgi:hypothetical protein
MPNSMKDLAKRNGNAINISNDYSAFKDYLQKNLKIKE